MSDVLTETDLNLTDPARVKMTELLGQVEEGVEGVRVYAAAGGCSGVNFGMTFTDVINSDDSVRDCDGIKVVVDELTLTHLRGVEIDFVDEGDGNPTFVFNNLPQAAHGGGCGGCSSQGSCC